MNCYLAHRPALICKQGTVGSATTSWQGSSQLVSFVHRPSGVQAVAYGVAPAAEELLAAAGPAAAPPSAGSGRVGLPIGTHNPSSQAVAHRTRKASTPSQQEQQQHGGQQEWSANNKLVSEQQSLSQYAARLTATRLHTQQQAKARHHHTDTEEPLQQQQPPPSTQLQQQQGRSTVWYQMGSKQDWSLPTGLAVTWLGTSSGAPSRDRNISCTVVRVPEALYPVDCGEGSHRQAHLTGLQLAQVDTIFITHLHGDHCFGIGGMLISINKARKEQQQQQGIRPMLSLAPAQELPGCEQGPAGLRLVGPPQLGPLVAAMLTGAGVGRRLDLPVYVTELVEQDSAAHGWQPLPGVRPGSAYLRRLAPQQCLPEASWQPDLRARLKRCGVDNRRQAYNSSSYSGRKRAQFEAKVGLSWSIRCQHASVTAAQLQHRVPCWGYVFDELPATAQAQQQQERQLQEQQQPQEEQEEEEVEASNTSSSSKHTSSNNQDKQQQAGREQEELPRRRVLILGDTMDSRAIAPFAVGADLLSHEATFARGMESKVVMAQHSTAYMAGRFAWAIQAKALVLTHFSARYEGSSGDVPGHGNKLATGSARGNSRASKQQGGGSGDELGEAGKAGASESQAVVALQYEAEECFTRGQVLLARDLFTAHVPHQKQR